MLLIAWTFQLVSWFTHILSILGPNAQFAENPAEAVKIADDGVIDLMDFNMDPEVSFF